MELADISIKPIGIINTPFEKTEGMPIQPEGAEGIKGEIHILPEYEEGLKDIEGFSYITLLFHLHKVKDVKLTVIPFLDDKPRGVFATRAPIRPNRIGVSTVKLIKRKERILYVENVDMLNMTPIIDIKPYVPEFDSYHDCSKAKTGWYEKSKGQAKHKKSDNRFDN